MEGRTKELADNSRTKRNHFSNDGIMYCSIQDIKDDLTEKVVAQLSNDENPNLVNEEIVSKYISESSQLIDGFLRSRYGLPL